MSDPWEDLFSQAAGVEPTGGVNIDTNPNRAANHQQSSQGGHVTSAILVDEEISQCVKGGSAASISWPSQFVLGGSLHGKDICKKFKPKASSSGSINNKCQRCGNSGAQHLLHLNKDDHKCVSQDIYVLARNIRCCAMYGINVAYAEKSGREIVRKHVAKMKSKCDVFNSKCTALQVAINSWRDAAMQQSGRDTGTLVDVAGLTSCCRLTHLEQRIAVIVAADALYYRLYYNQVTGTAGKIEASCSLVPNLCVHFVTPNLARDVDDGEESWSSFVSDINDKVKDKCSPCAMTEIVRFDDASPSIISNPLFELYKARMKETVQLFYTSGWFKQGSVQKQHIEAIRAYRSSKQQQEEHETPAAKTLVMWRDSCRDFPCNIYAYASITSPMLTKMKDVLVSNGIEGLIEVGAGTGYIAHLIKQAGLSIEALDIAPTSNNVDLFNDYHGKSPSFTLVKKGGPSNLVDIVHAKKKALLLCYPPPGSSMARDCLRNFVKSGGEYIVHIGEYSGLTGCTRFEALLSTNFRCELRMPCPSWGTDAAFLAIFRKNDGKRKEEHAVLLPCSNCSVRSAEKRCVLVRSLVYCGKNCFSEHSRPRREIFRERMIFFDDEHSKCLDFEDGMCYRAIEERGGIGVPLVSSGRAKKKKRKLTR